MMLNELTAHELKAKLDAREVSSEEATRVALARIDQVEPKVHSYAHLQAEEALARARQIDQRRAAGESLGALAGLPIAIKDNFCTRVGPTTCGSRMLETFHAPYDAAVVERLLAADAVILGKTNMDEFAMGSSTETSMWGPTRNPWRLECVAGGSSGGSAAAVATGECAAALGSDTGGSIRQPAAFCGCVGLKPTYGRVSRYGLVAFASSLDQIGPITRDVTDAAMLLGAIAGHDPRDSTSVPESQAPVPDYRTDLDKGVKGLKIGRPKEYFGEGLNHEVASAIDRALKTFAEMGAEIVDVSLPRMEYGVACYYLIATAEASSNLARYDGVHYGHRSAEARDYVQVYTKSRAEGFGAEVKRRIMLGTYVLSAGYYDAYYLKALKVRRLIKEDFDAAFKQCDVIAGPASPATAFRLGEKIEDPLAMYLLDLYTISVNLAALPALSLPCGRDRSGLPIGLQLISPVFTEPLLRQTARAYERTAGEATVFDLGGNP